MLRASLLHTTVHRRWLGAVALALLAGCATTSRVSTQTLPTDAAPHDNLNATLWMQNSAEYRAAVLGSYTLARQQLDAALADPAWDALPRDERAAIERRGFESLPPAVITDVDETLVDNSPFQARGVLADSAFKYDRWLTWVKEARARALPGAVEFTRYAASRGVTVYFVTNRDAPAEVEATIAMLRTQGFPVAPDASNVMLRGDVRTRDREKGERRRWVGERHRVLLMLGDNLGDFLDDAGADIDERQAQVDRHADYWGTRWIMLPNPSYGAWESAILRACGERGRSTPQACKRETLRTQ